MQQRYFCPLQSLIKKLNPKYKALILKFFISETTTQFPPFTGIIWTGSTGFGSGDCPSPNYQGCGNTSSGVYEIR